AALDRLRGMFAFALYDRLTDTVHAVRDPFGIKPLYYLRTPDGLWLASEKKALVPFTADCASVDREALSFYLTLQYVPEPHSMHPDIRRLEPGRRLTHQPSGEVHIERFFRPLFHHTPAGGGGDVFAELRAALRDSVRAHLVADV